MFETYWAQNAMYHSVHIMLYKLSPFIIVYISFCKISLSIENSIDTSPRVKAFEILKENLKT